MPGMEGEGMLLGKATPVVNEYSPQLLHPIPRAPVRLEIGLEQMPSFYGADLWHAYELSWLESGGKPVVRVGRFTVPASSPNIVESKSFKLYLNSLNSTVFASVEQARQTIAGDISAAAGQSVELELLAVDDPSLAGITLPGVCLDDLPLPAPERESAGGATVLQHDPAQVVEEKLYSHLMRSLCPVTGQPDWATVWLQYRGPAIDHQPLLQYIISYREHQEFHEQCVERIFADICRSCAPQSLTVQAFYTRRGGLDINPVRSTDPDVRPYTRLDRQ